MNNIILIAGPCVVESESITFSIADKLVSICKKLDIPLIFKASYKKANRTSIDSFTGIGIKEALRILQQTGKHYSIPVTTDVHSVEEVDLVAMFVDVIQIPAFLCRQTDLLIAAAAQTDKIIHVKKGQFASASTMCYAVEKVKKYNDNIVRLIERGTFFGYNDLVVDMRNIPLMQQCGVEVIADITHSNNGNPQMSETIGKCAIAAGADGIFLETHPDPSTALSDSASMIKLDDVENLLVKFIKIRNAL